MASDLQHYGLVALISAPFGTLSKLHGSNLDNDGSEDDNNDEKNG